VLSFLFTTTLHFGIILLRQATVASEVFIDYPFITERAFITYPILSMLAINTIILIICDLLLAIQKKENAESEVEQLEVKNLKAQKRILMQQLQPHFLFNTLTALKSLIKENPEEAENYTVKLSEFLRYTIQVNSDHLVKLEDELKFMNDYLQLQKIRFENSLICKTDIPADVYYLKLPAFALQTLVENAIKHNSFTEKKPLHIKIQYNNGGISVWNNRLLSKVESTPGTGLKNLNDRYKMTTGKEIEVRDNKDEFCVTVQLINSDSI
jgi:LytS/YehU family sensor histidine kinase